MNENKIIAALLTVACNAAAGKESGADRRDRIIDEYDYFLQRLEKKESESVPEPQQNLANMFKSRSKKDD